MLRPRRGVEQANRTPVGDTAYAELARDACDVGGGRVDDGSNAGGDNDYEDVDSDVVEIFYLATEC